MSETQFGELSDADAKLIDKIAECAVRSAFSEMHDNGFHDSRYLFVESDVGSMAGTLSYDLKQRFRRKKARDVYNICSS